MYHDFYSLLCCKVVSRISRSNKCIIDEYSASKLNHSTMHIDTPNNPIHECNKPAIPSSEEWNQLKYEIENSFIPKNTIIESRPFEVDDFIGVLDNVKSCFEKLTIFSLIPPEDLSASSRNRYECISYAIIFCGEHSSKNVWTDDDCMAASRTTLKTIMSACLCETLNDYMIKVDQRETLHGVNLLSFILPKLSKEEWQYYPSITCCFTWLLSHIELPFMKHFIQIALPISLNILEDYATSSKQIGLKCLYQILTNISATELQWHIQLELLQNMLKRYLYFRECELILLVISCALDVAEKSQPNMKHTGVSLQWSFYDEILNIALPLMEFEQNIEIRQLYGDCLCLIAKSANVSAIRWLPRFLRIIEDYSKTDITEKHAMLALNLCLRWCWPVADQHWRRINVIAGRIIFNSENTEAIRKAEICIRSLKDIAPKDAAILDVEAIRSKKKESNF
ncbi:TELO2-interacting protein 2-like [Planococcus citri]|uniref:TELO2-interacting protein 2-like n=1 Tax=Planococcus citri TaxID=170843 RepID=UPI0031F9E0FD